MVTVHLQPEVEKRLREKAAEQGKSIEEYLSWLADDWYRRAAREPGKPPDLTTEERIALWRTWGERHQSNPGFVDDSRDSIYEGRGE